MCPVRSLFGLLNVNAIGFLTPLPLPSEIETSPIYGTVDSEERAFIIVQMTAKTFTF